MVVVSNKKTSIANVPPISGLVMKRKSLAKLPLISEYLSIWLFTITPSRSFIASTVRLCSGPNDFLRFSAALCNSRKAS